MRSRPGWIIWLLGAAGGALALGPALAPGGILHLDFVLLPHAPVPNGVWGLGPELPRRTPLLLPLAWLDPVIGSVAAGKLLAIVAVAAAFAGACRLAGGLELPWRLAAGLVYAMNPFVLTRLAVGHLFVLASMAVLPWVVPWLVGSRRTLRLTYLGGLALGLTGALGGLFAIVLAGAGAVSLPGWRQRGSQLAVVIAAQVPWLVPGVVVWSAGASLADSSGFRSDLTGAGGPLGLFGGLGFWQESFQVGASAGVIVPILGLLLLGLALLGHRQLDPDVARPLGVLAALALVWVILSGWSATSGVYEWLTDLPGGAVLREGQRVLPLLYLWLAPAAALGGPVLGTHLRRARSVAPALPLVAALLLVGPLIWGSGGQLRSTRIPQDWEQARALVRAQPGSVLALPWFQYLDLALAEGERVLNPLPLWLGGDVLTASNPRLPGGSGLERSDPREPHAARLVAESLRGEPIAGDLAALGVRWVVVLRDGDLLRGVPTGVLHAEALAEDPGLAPRLAGEHIEVYEVRGWRGSVRTADGAPVDLDPIVTPLAGLEHGGAAVWARPGAPGWMRGGRSAGVADNGLIALPSGSGPVWYWPSLVVMISYISSLAAVAILIKKRRRLT